MPNDIDIGVALMFLWGLFAFIGFVVVMSILQALLEYFVKPYKKKEKDNGRQNHENIT